MISLLKSLHSRLGDWIEKLEDRQPKAPCDPLVAADVARLSRRILEHNKTVNPYLDIAIAAPFPQNADITSRMTVADYFPDLTSREEEKLKIGL